MDLNVLQTLTENAIVILDHHVYVLLTFMFFCWTVLIEPEAHMQTDTLNQVKIYCLHQLNRKSKLIILGAQSIFQR